MDQFNNSMHDWHAPSQKRGGIIGFLINRGIAKNTSQANMMLIIIAVVAIVLAAILFASTGPDDSVDRSYNPSAHTSDPTYGD